MELSLSDQTDLDAQLKSGVDDEYDIHSSDASTTYIPWVRNFQFDIKELSRKREYPSQTEIECILVREAVSASKMIFRETTLNWVEYLEMFYTVGKRDTESRRRLEKVVDGAIADMTTFSLSLTDKTVDYRMKTLKKDKRRLATHVDRHNVPVYQRVIMGLSSIILENKGMFSAGTVDSAEVVYKETESQAKMAGAEGIHLDRVSDEIKRADDRDELYFDQLSSILSKIRQSKPGMYEYVAESFERKGLDYLLV